MNLVHPSGNHGVFGNHLGWRGTYGYGIGDWSDHLQWSGDLCVRHTRTCYWHEEGKGMVGHDRLVWEFPTGDGCIPLSHGRA